MAAGDEAGRVMATTEQHQAMRTLVNAFKVDTNGDGLSFGAASYMDMVLLNLKPISVNDLAVGVLLVTTAKSVTLEQAEERGLSLGCYCANSDMCVLMVRSIDGSMLEVEVVLDGGETASPLFETGKVLWFNVEAATSLVAVKEGGALREAVKRKRTIGVVQEDVHKKGKMNEIEQTGVIVESLCAGGKPFLDFDRKLRYCSNMKEANERLKIVQGLYRTLPETLIDEFISDVKFDQARFIAAMLSCLHGSRFGPGVSITDLQFHAITRLRGMALLSDRKHLEMAIMGKWQITGLRSARPTLDWFVASGSQLQMSSVDAQDRNILAASVENLACFYGVVYGPGVAQCFDAVLTPLRSHRDELRHATIGYIVSRIESFLAHFFGIIFQQGGSHLLPGYDNYCRPNMLRLLQTSLEDAANIFGIGAAGEDKTYCTYEVLPHYLFYQPGGVAEQMGIGKLISAAAVGTKSDGTKSNRKTDPAKQAAASNAGLCMQHTCHLLGLKPSTCRMESSCRFRHLPTLSELLPGDVTGGIWDRLRLHQPESVAVIKATLAKNAKDAHKK